MASVTQFCIDASLLGTHLHLLCSSGSFAWSSTVPDGAYHLTGCIKPCHDRCMDTLLRLNAIELDLAVPVRFSTAMNLVMSSSSMVPPWQKVMPQAEHRAFMKRLVGAATEAMAKADRGYFEGTWVPGNVVLRSLQRANMDVEAMATASMLAPRNAYVLETFKPSKDGTAAPVTYNRFGTLTGRCTVASGPSILTLKKEHRSVIRSSYGARGKVMSIDFSSVEPRVALYEAGGKCDGEDLYTSIAADVGYQRDVVKAAVISELYGRSVWTLKQSLKEHRVEEMKGISVERIKAALGTDDLLRRIKDRFDTKGLLKRAKEQFIKDGYIVNHYGRKVKVDEPLDHVLVNYYMQSTAADVALLGFSELVSHMPSSVRPLYLIYDALIIDVPIEYVEQVMKVTSVAVPGFVQEFPLSINEICEDIGTDSGEEEITVNVHNTFEGQ